MLTRITLLLFPFLFVLPKITYGQTTLNGKPSLDQVLKVSDTFNTSKEAKVLSCPEVRARINQMLDLHYSYKEFSNELSQRTFYKIFENFDSAKIFFTASDINSFKSLKYEIGKKIESNNCSFIFEIFNSLQIHVKNRIEKAKKILSNPLSFSPPLTMETGKLQWARNEKELDDRLTKKIVFQFLNMKDNNLPDSVVKAQGDSPSTRDSLWNTYLRLEKKISSMSQDKIYSLLLNSFAQSLDPHSSHMLPSDQDSFSIHISNKLEGIGAQLQEENGAVIVKSLISGGVAQKDGRLKVNDIIVAVDSGNGSGLQDLTYMDVDQVVDLIRGKKGTTVKLVVFRKSAAGNEKMNISFVRDEINLQDENVQSALYNYHGEKIGILKIPTFYTDLKCKNKLFARCQGVAYDTEQELKKLTKAGATGILIDLRNDGGGDFPESIKLSSLFIPRGVIVQTVDKNKYVTQQEAVDASWVYKGPLIVLVNRYSASASEIFAGAIQDYERGIIVGDDHTYGKATVQVVQEIPGSDGRKSDGALKVTQSKFYRPGGTSNQRIGVHSDLLDQGINVAYDIGEENLDYALPLDTIAPANGFKPLQNLSSLIQNLKQLSIARTEKNAKYKALQAKIAKIKNEKNKLLPLTPEYIKSLEDWQNADEQINKNAENDAAEKPSLVKQDDVQLMEAIAITADTINLSKGMLRWVGERN